MSASQELLDKIGSRRIVASVSGGKDSAAMSLHLRELGIDHDRVFLDTGWEHPATYEYLRSELTRVIGPITEVRAPLGLADLSRKKGMFPSRTRRFCTQELKVFPMQRFLRERADDGHDDVNAVGIRAAESQARAKMPEWEWSEAFDCETWRPLIAWAEQDVIDIHRRHGLQPNPLYLRGHSRVGCYPCIFANKDELRLVAENDPQRIDEIRALEAEVQASAQAREGKSTPTMFSLRVYGDEAGEGRKEKHIQAGIDEVVTWARTERGGRQMMMFHDPPDAGCMRWGLCETDAPSK